jgi:hypothetical protein
MAISGYFGDNKNFIGSCGMERLLSPTKLNKKMTEPYLPKDDPGKVTWLNNIALKLSTYKKQLGLADDVDTLTQNDAENFAYIINNITVFRKYSNEITTYKNILRNGSATGTLSGTLPDAPATLVFPQPVVADIFGRVRSLVRTIKNAGAAYTEDIGKDLGIIGADSDPNSDEMQPILTNVFIAGHPHLKYKKNGMQGIHIYVDRGDGNGFIYLATSTLTDFADLAALPATGTSAIWTYKAIYILHDAEVGQMSLPLAVTVSALL